MIWPGVDRIADNLCQDGVRISNTSFWRLLIAGGTAGIVYGGLLQAGLACQAVMEGLPWASLAAGLAMLLAWWWGWPFFGFSCINAPLALMRREISAGSLAYQLLVVLAGNTAGIVLAGKLVSMAGIMTARAYPGASLALTRAGAFQVQALLAILQCPGTAQTARGVLGVIFLSLGLMLVVRSGMQPKGGLYFLLLMALSGSAGFEPGLSALGAAAAGLDTVRDNPGQVAAAVMAGERIVPMQVNAMKDYFSWMHFIYRSLLPLAGGHLLGGSLVALVLYGTGKTARDDRPDARRPGNEEV